MNPASAPPKAALYVFGTALVVGAAYVGYHLHTQTQRLDRLTELVESRDTAITQILGEVTRLRIEQRTDQKGPQALLESLRTYAPLLVSAGTPEPDYKRARAEMDAILRAFTTVGKDAWQPVIKRIDALDGHANFDELKWLLEAAVAIDARPGLDLVKSVVIGQKMPAPRLRWHAADILLRHDLPLAQATLRQVMLTESSRGINPERAAAYGTVIPDTAAVATSGFHNFIDYYVRSGDSAIDETLLMVIGRTEHDLITVQECVKVLGSRRCERAVEPIQKLFENPPGHLHNPLFQNHCLDALANIQGEAARPFFERQLPDATTETVKRHLEHLLSAPIQSKAAGVAPTRNK